MKTFQRKLFEFHLLTTMQYLRAVLGLDFFVITFDRNICTGKIYHKRCIYLIHEILESKLFRVSVNLNKEVNRYLLAILAAGGATYSSRM